MLLRLTHLAFVSRGPAQPRPDAIAIVEGSSPAAPERVFVPGWLPCGECTLCRRGLAGACARGVTPVATALTSDARPGTLDLPDRFLCPIDQGNPDAPLSDAVAAAAGAVATVIEAHARSGLGPGDTAHWTGAGVLAQIGTRVATARLGGRATESDRGVHRVFIDSDDDSLASQALAAVGPGGTVTYLGARPAGLAAWSGVPGVRVLLGCGGYDPDFIPEALATLRRREIDVAPFLDHRAWQTSDSILTPSPYPGDAIVVITL